MTPEELLRPLLKKYTLPESLVHLLFLLVQKEIETDFASLAGADDPLLKLAKGLDHIFSKLPPIGEPRASSLTATLHDLAGIDDRDTEMLFNLRTPVEWHNYYDERSSLKRSIDAYQREIDAKEATSYTRSILRDYKEQLRELKEPEPRPYLTSFWLQLLYFRVSYQIPQKLRTQHTHVMGATGTGKSQLLSRLIYQDIEANASVIVMTLKGSLLPTIARVTDPQRLIYLSPQSPIPINIFDLESHAESSIELIHDIFATSNTETTGKQTTLLENCIRLLLATPGSHLRTLRTLMKSQFLPEEFKPYVSLLPESGQEFFNERFHMKGEAGYGGTKEQIMWRLDAVDKPLINRMFCTPKSELDLTQVMTEGKVLLIDTSVKDTGEQGSSFLGKTMLALITIAAQQRKDTSRPVYVYVDEAGNYMTPKLAIILERCREANVGLTLAHQQLNQLKELEASVMTNTIIKFIGTCSMEDARKLAPLLRLLPDQLTHRDDLNFALYARGFLSHPINVPIKYGYVESLPQRSEKELHDLIASNREPPASPRIEEAPQSPPDIGTDSWS